MRANPSQDAARSWCAEFQISGGAWEEDPQRFLTYAAALSYAKDLQLKLAAITDFRIHPSRDEPTRD